MKPRDLLSYAVFQYINTCDSGIEQDFFSATLISMSDFPILDLTFGNLGFGTRVCEYHNFSAGSQ